MKFYYLIVLIIIFSCSKENEAVNADLGYAYAGLEVGNYVVYDVDSFFYDDFDNTIDSNYYKIKEEVDSKFIDLEGEDAFKIIRYRKQNDTTDWVVTDVWTSKITASNYQKVEENIRFIKLIFPARDSKTWNGNALNNNATFFKSLDGVWKFNWVRNPKDRPTTFMNLNTNVSSWDDIRSKSSRGRAVHNAEIKHPVIKKVVENNVRHKSRVSTCLEAVIRAVRTAVRRSNGTSKRISGANNFTNQLRAKQQQPFIARRENSKRAERAYQRTERGFSMH